MNLKLLHIGIHNSLNKNAGDTVLFLLVRKVFDHFLGSISWELKQVWDIYSEQDSNNINKKFDGIIIGGGGLLLRDQAGSDTSNSGWQWNSTIESLESTLKPIIIFAIGYNRFRNQPEFDDIFFKHIVKLASKSSFFGLRNNGSIESLKNYLPSNLASKLTRQYCPTLISWQIFPKYQEIVKSHERKNKKFLSLNVAFDREDLRFGNNKSEKLKELAYNIKIAQDKGWKIILTAHKHIDLKFSFFLDQQNIKYEIANLTELKTEEILDFYSRIDLAVGMRGHSQMIPFGLRRPIISIITHNKIKFFLEDIDKLEWGIELEADDFSVKFFHLLNLIENNKKEILKEIKKTQTKIWIESQKNFSKIKKLFI